MKTVYRLSVSKTKHYKGISNSRMLSHIYCDLATDNCFAIVQKYMVMLSHLPTLKNM